MKKKVLLSLLALNGAVYAGAAVHENFTAPAAGVRLAGFDAKTGGVTWKASSNLRVGTTANPGAVVANSYSFVACVPVAAEGDVIRVGAVCNIKTAAPQGWVGIGLGNPDVTQAETQWKTGVFLMIDAGGKYQSFADFGGDKLYLASKTIEGFDVGIPHALKLEYNRTSRILDMWIDDVQIVQAYNLASKGRTPDVSFAGFSGYKPMPDVPLVEEFDLAVRTESTTSASAAATPNASKAAGLLGKASAGSELAKSGDVVFEERFGNAAVEDLKKAWSPEGAVTWLATTDREGLVFEVQPGVASDSMKIRRKLDVDLIRGSTVLVSARIRGETISKKVKPWNGVKVALRIDTPSQASYPQVRPAPEGTFGWTNVSTVITIPANAKTVNLYIGLEAVFGKLWIDTVAVKVLEVARSAPVVPQVGGTRIKGHPLPRLRGAMVRTATTEEDLRVLGQEWNANVIRWQLGGLQYKTTGLGNPVIDTIMDEEIAKLDSMLPSCKKYGLYVVVDLHSPGMKTFESTANQDKLVEIWKKLAAHYKGNPAIWGYDIVNEPRLDEWKAGSLLWNDLAERVCREIRDIDPDTTIIVEPEKMGLPEGFSTLRPVPFSNVVYSVHMYNPGQFTHNRVYDKNQQIYTYPGDIEGTVWNREELRRNLQPVIDFQKKYGVPIYVGEFSAIRWSPGAAQYLSDVIEIFEENDWDWTYHAFREFQGWSVEHGSDINDTAPSATPTERGKVLRSWFAKNKKPAWTEVPPVLKSTGTLSRVYRRVIFVGDSITKSAPQVEKLGWAGNWGMAASAEDKDFVHLFMNRLAQAQGGDKPEFLVAGGRGGKIPDKVAVKQQLTDFMADLAIVQLGENDVENITEEQFQKPYEELLQAIRAGQPDARIICMGVWSPPKGNPTKDKFIKAACENYGATFADMSEANADPGNKAEAENRFTHKGVNWHPGDKGMEAYVRAIWSALTGTTE